MQVPVITLGNAAFLQYVHNFLRGSPRVDRRVMQERDPLFRRPPRDVDVGDEGMDDLPDDAAQYLAAMAAKAGNVPDQPSEGGAPTC